MVCLSFVRIVRIPIKLNCEMRFCGIKSTTYLPNDCCLRKRYPFNCFFRIKYHNRRSGSGIFLRNTRRTGVDSFWLWSIPIYVFYIAIDQTTPPPPPPPPPPPRHKNKKNKKKKKKKKQ